jgi:hypothetical protein
MKSPWTFETLKEHLDAQREAVDRRHTDLATERNRAVDAALAAANEKAKSHNDILGALKDAQGQFVSKTTLFWAVSALISGAGLAWVIIKGVGG